MIPVNLNFLHTNVLLSRLAELGLRHAVISPGSRSTPLALTAFEHPNLKTYVILDERSAGFFALGLSKCDGLPAALICTSGTAAANYFPAVIEAAQSGVPLILLTADRPVELRNTGAPQTINQENLYGIYPRFYGELPPARLELVHLRNVQNLAEQAYQAAMNSPRGPVHLNIPLDEPLAPIAQDSEIVADLWKKWQAETRREFSPDPDSLPKERNLDKIRGELRDSLCGLIVCGPGAACNEDESEAIYSLARTLGWPLLADIVSGVRYVGEPALPFFDIFLRDESFASLEPDLILQFGGYPTSKILASYLDRHRSARTIRVGTSLHSGDPLFRDAEFIECEPKILCRTITSRFGPNRDSLLLESFQRASRIIRDELNSVANENASDCEALFVFHAVRQLNANANIVLASSLPIRYGDALLAPEGHVHRMFGLRGANGIDGTISHAAGIAAASDRRTLLVTGDLAFLHDLGGLFAAIRHARNLDILLLDNNGGGIFHFLPVHEQEEARAFKELHGTPHDLDLSHAAGLFGLEWHNVKTFSDLGALSDGSKESPRVFHVRTSRERNHRAYSQLIERLKRACAS